MQSVENVDVVDVADVTVAPEAAVVDAATAETVATTAAEPVVSLSADALLARLCESFPLCFSARGECRPLKIGILDALVAATAGWPGVSKTRLREVLRAQRQEQVAKAYVDGMFNTATLSIDGAALNQVIDASR